MNSPYFTAPDDGVLEGYALSPQQANQWRWQQSGGGGAVPPASLTMRIDAPVDQARLRASLEMLVSQHEILRTGYRQLPGMALPMQVIAPTAALDWNEDGPDLPAVRLTPGADGAMRVCLRLPAFQADAASMTVLARDWLAAYRDGALPNEPLQYADYAAWRGELLESAEQPHPLWEKYRALDVEAPLPLQARTGTHSGPAVHASQVFELNPTVERRWREYSAASGHTAETVLLAAWIALVHQHSAGEQLAIGLDSQQRTPAVQGAIGLYGEPLPLSVDRLDTLNFAELCAEIERQSELLTEWRDSYPADLIDKPFTLGFRWIPPADAGLAQAGWHLEEIVAQPAPTQLLLEAGPCGQRWHFNQTVYGPAAIDLLGDQLATLLDSACRQPAALLGELAACSPAEQLLLAGELSESLPLNDEQQQRYQIINALDSLTECFARQAATLPDSTAVKGPGGALTYRELDEQSTVLSHHLLERGLTPQGRVVHLLPRDFGAVVAMLAIFKAGACYVPIDPAYPAQRAQFILDDCKAQLILTHSSLLPMLAPAMRERAICIDALPSAAPSTTQAPATKRQDCAYLIYTSGSTGQPKGVQITHANALHSLAARVAYYPEPVGTFLLLSSFAFDSSIAGLFWSLAQGGTLLIASEEEQKDPGFLAQTIRAKAVTHMLALPSLYALLLERFETPAQGLSTVIVAGEACPAELVRAHHQLQPQARLYNEYGPTEASVWSSVALCADVPQQSQVSIGRAIPHTRVFVLDTRRAPAARGMIGEIHIAGPGLSPGYADRPELTGEKFITATHPALVGLRLYRTGDSGYLDQDGRLMFAGRADSQVKLRGYRIELGEIESALRDASGAALAVALADTREGTTQLRAFIEAPASTDLAALRATLALRLPEYMVPSDIQALPALPRSANGKVDAKALLALRVSHQRPPYVAPDTPAEHQLASLWRQLLACDDPGVNDDFFALGGHSLLVVRLVHLIKANMGADIPVGTVFSHPTIRSLAAQLASAPVASSLVLLRAGAADRAPLFFLHRPSGDVQHYASLVDALAPGQAAFGIVLPTGVGPEQASLTDLAHRYLNDIKSVQAKGPYHLCGWSMGGLLALEIASLIERQGERVGLLAIVDSSFDAGDAGLCADDLLHVVCQELTDDSCRRLQASPDARTSLEQLDPSLGKLAQLRQAFEQWLPAHGMELATPPAIIAATLEAMSNARKWVASYSAPVLSSELHLWWADATLARQPGLPMRWAARSTAAVHHVRIPGDHDDIVSDSTFIKTFNTVLARLTTPVNLDQQ